MQPLVEYYQDRITLSADLFFARHAAGHALADRERFLAADAVRNAAGPRFGHGAARLDRHTPRAFFSDHPADLVRNPFSDLFADHAAGSDRDPFHLETSVPGVFAVGDVRAESVKRVASAVGEGAMAVSLVHRWLENR